MKRYVTLEEISDGKLYKSNDMVKADCQGCQGCSDCCKGMGESLVLDPCDVYSLSIGTGKSFEMLMQGFVELHVVDGVILPNIAMTGEKEQCRFLDEKGRCSVHDYRPGICRMFPLGRYYTEDGFSYILQTEECPKERIKIKVGKWLGIANLKEYERFILNWHNLLKDAENTVTALSQAGKDEDVKKLNMILLQLFFFTPYEGQDFYQEVSVRMGQFRQLLTK